MLGFVVPTVGRWSAVTSLLDSLAAAAAGDPLEVVVVRQGSNGSPAPELARPGLSVVMLDDDGWGASRARNRGLSHLSSAVTHVVWPNDHSSYSAPALAAVRRHLDRGVVVGRLVESGADRYPVQASFAPFDRVNVWDAIEPVTAISRRLVGQCEGWAESLGTGANSPWQSSALADLLLRLPAGTTVAWEPEFVATGPGFTRGSSGSELDAKVRSYGRGYGRVLSRWNYPWRRRLGSVLKPLVQPGYRVGPDVLPLRARLAAAVGRAEGVSGHLLPGADPAPRQRSDVTIH